MRGWPWSGRTRDLAAHAPVRTTLSFWPGMTAASAVLAVAVGAFGPSLHGSVHRPGTTGRATTLGQAPPPRDSVASVTEETSAPAATRPAPSTARSRPGPSADPIELVEVTSLAADGIPQTALLAYTEAAARADAAHPSCALPWPLLAAIGRVESDHGRVGGAVLYADGTSSHKIIGIRLDGTNAALVRDTDHGRLDGDTRYDHAVGPMQFIPSTWAVYGTDGNGDGVKDPFNVFDAAAAAADYLCIAGGDLGTAKGQARAVLAYNHSSAYLGEVLGLERVYAAGVGLVVPVGPRPPKPPRTTLPPVNPGPPAPDPRHRGRSSASPSGTPTPSPSRRSSSRSSPSPSPSSRTPTACGSPTASPSVSASSSGTSSSGPSSGPTSTSPSGASSSASASPTRSPTPSCPSR